jgi:ABC-type sugar transport system permease subunit
MMSPIKFVGFDNYINLFHDIAFLRSFKNTGLYVLIYVPISVIFSLIIAFLLNEKWLKGKDLFRVIFYIPAIVSSVAISMIWKWIYNPSYGLLNQFIGLFGIQRQFWLEDARFAIPALVLITVWQTFGYNVVLFMAGLLSIPTDFFEAAEVDGASKWQITKLITLPLLAPTTIFVIVISVINSFQVFDQVLVLGDASGPPANLMVTVYYLYKVSFGSFKMGYGTTMGLVLFLAILFITIIQFNYYTKRFEE